MQSIYQFNSSFHHYCLAMERRGFQLIGKGLYSRVYSKPGSEIAIKVCNGQDEWADYIEWATASGYSGTFAPKVYSLKYHGEFCVAIMERLVCTIGSLPYGVNIDQKNQWELTYCGSNRELEPEDMKEFYKKVRQAGFWGDMHGGNFMLRKDGQLVLIDPSSHCSSGKKLRIKNGKIVHSEQC